MTFVRINNTSSPVHGRIGVLRDGAVSVDYQLYPVSPGDTIIVNLGDGLNLYNSLETMAEFGRRCLATEETAGVAIQLSLFERSETT